MKVRPLSPTGDYQLGVALLVNAPQAVAQCVSTRLKLWAGEWFLDKTVGVPYTQNVLGRPNTPNPDVYIKQVILDTQGVDSLISYQSSYDGTTRTLDISCTIQTIYGVATVDETLQVTS